MSFLKNIFKSNEQIDVQYNGKEIKIIGKNGFTYDNCYEPEDVQINRDKSNNIESIIFL